MTLRRKTGQHQKNTLIGKGTLFRATGSTGAQETWLEQRKASYLLLGGENGSTYIWIGDMRLGRLFQLRFG